ncbi:MAG TPA: HD domain-containing phosphohydrolase [Rhodocyclaceae bacterium]
MNGEHDRYENLARQVLLRHAPQFHHARIPPSDVAGMLSQQAARLIDADPFLRQLAARSSDPLAMRHAISRLDLPAPFAALLALARRERPELIQHVLRVAVIAHYLALCREMSAPEIDDLLLAALGHDLGELYTDPALLDPGHTIDGDERRYIYVHPITGFLIAREIAGLDGNVALTVLHHQERLDGSGYPYGLRAERIALASRIIAIADVSAAILARFASHQRLDALMRLNRQKFDIGLLALLHEGVHHGAAPAGRHCPAAFVRLTAAAGLLERWKDFRPALARNGMRPEFSFLVERMATLRHMLLQFGFDPESQDLLLDLIDEDSQVAAELDAALDEVHWQFRDLDREIGRRRETMEPLLDADGKRLLNEWSGQIEAYLETVGD